MRLLRDGLGLHAPGQILSVTRNRMDILAEVTPDMGAMRFVDKSHLEGPLGSTFNGDDDGGFLGAGNILEQYPKLVSESVEELKEHKWPTDATGGVLELTEPFHYQPGDCTLHHGWCVHGGPDNTTPDPRWSYLFAYSPADTRYWPEEGETTGTSTATNPGTRRRRSGDEINPLIRPGPKL